MPTLDGLNLTEFVQDWTMIVLGRILWPRIFELQSQPDSLRGVNDLVHLAIASNEWVSFFRFIANLVVKRWVIPDFHNANFFREYSPNFF